MDTLVDTLADTLVDTLVDTFDGTLGPLDPWTPRPLGTSNHAE